MDCCMEESVLEFQKAGLTRLPSLFVSLLARTVETSTKKNGAPESRGEAIVTATRRNSVHCKHDGLAQKFLSL